MTATEELRRLLTEAGVEWKAHRHVMPGSMAIQRETLWGQPTDVASGKPIPHVYHYRATEMGDGRLFLEAQLIAPEQAIAATLGSCNCSNDCTNSERTETCHNASKVMDEHGQARFACSECHAWIDSRLLWNPEYRNGESPWVNNCKLNFCPNCGRRVVDPTTNDVDAEVAR